MRLLTFTLDNNKKIFPEDVSEFVPTAASLVYRSTDEFGPSSKSAARVQSSKLEIIDEPLH